MPSSLDELINAIRVKEGKWTRTTMQNGHLRSCKRTYMRKLKGDIPASDKENLSRDFVQLQELIACRKVISAGNPQIFRCLSSRNKDASSLQSLFPYQWRPSLRVIWRHPFAEHLSSRILRRHNDK
jgi:hypothetical protein